MEHRLDNAVMVIHKGGKQSTSLQHIMYHPTVKSNSLFIGHSRVIATFTCGMKRKSISEYLSWIRKWC